jgi:hypothetical protein
MFSGRGWVEGRTKSSPIGPAEHDDGGSLQTEQTLADAILYLLILMVKPLMDLHGTPLVQEPHHHVGFDSGGVMVRVYIPAQVCKFLVDSLQRHREGIMCCEEDLGRSGRVY